MQTYLYHLTFKGPVHFGNHGIGLEETSVALGSDALCSALINAFALQGNAGEVIEALCGGQQPAFTLSSLFPFGPKKGGSRIYVVPRPVCLLRFEDPDDARLFGKQLKKRRWLLPDEAAVWLSRKPLSKGLAEKLSMTGIDEGGSSVPWKAEAWWVADLRPRVALDRSSSNSAVWWCATVNFTPGSGLYGLVRFSDDRWKDRLMAAFELLGQMGLGGERTYGMGEFEISEMVPMDQIDGLSKLATADKALLLSRYYPAPDEREALEKDLVAWDVAETRGHVVTGRHATGIKRKRIRVLVEGCVAVRHLAGAMVDVTPNGAEALGLDHRVYRCGLGFWLGKGGAT